MKLFALLLTLSIQSAYATFSLNSLNIPLDEDNPSALAINGKLFYLDENRQVWINHSNTLSSTKIMIDGQAVIAKTPVLTENYVLFINQSDNDTLWRTDGEQFERLSDLQLNRLSKYQSSIVNAQIKDSDDFITTDGESVNRYVIFPLTQTIDSNVSLASAFVCQFDENNLIFRAVNSQTTNASKYYFYENGEISPVQFMIGENEVDPELVLQHDNKCIYRFFNNSENIAHHFIIDDSGDVAEITSNDEDWYFDNYFIFSDKLLAFRKHRLNYSITYAPLLYSLENNQFELINDFNNENLFVKDFWVNNNYLYIQNYSGCIAPIPPGISTKCSPNPPNNGDLFVIDSSFNVENKIFDKRIENQEIDILNSVTSAFVIFDDNNSALSMLASGQLVSSLLNTNIEIIDIIGEAENGYYFHGKDKNSGRNLVYLASDTPVISHQLAGLWTSPDWQSQGMTVFTGQRQDNSEYLFLSFYFYRNGEPFWIAGSTELNSGTSSLSLDIYEFKGASFLPDDPNSEHQKIDFGSITLIPASCNNIAVEMTPINSETIYLSMERFPDFTNSNSCSD